MALLFMDGMDQYTTNADFPDKWDETHTTVANFKSGGGKFGGGAIRVHGRPWSTAPLGKRIPGIFAQKTDLANASAASDTLFVSYHAWFNDTSAATNYHVEFGSGHLNTNATCTVGWASNKVTIYKGNARTLAATSVGANIATGQWVLVEIAFVCGNAGVGSCEVWHDGVSMIADTTSDFAYADAGSVGTVNFGVSATATSTTGGWVDVDDVVIYDDTGSTMNARMGGHKIRTHIADADATQNDFTPSAGTDHAALVGTAGGINTATYLESSTATDAEVFTHTAQAEIPTEIYAVGSNSVLYEAAAGTTPREFVGRTIPVSTERDGSARYTMPIAQYWTRSTYWEVNPEDSLEWEVADIDGAEFGLEITK